MDKPTGAERCSMCPNTARKVGKQLLITEQRQRKNTNNEYRTKPLGDVLNTKIKKTLVKYQTSYSNCKQVCQQLMLEKDSMK